MSVTSHSKGSPSSLLIFKKARKAHKWLMALVGVQVFIWAMTGAYMVFPNIHYIHGDHLIKHTMQNLDETIVKLSFSQVLNRYPTAKNIQLGWLGDRAIYRFTYLNKNEQLPTRVMLDATTGLGIKPLQMVDVINLVPELLLLPKTTNSLIDSVMLLDIDSTDYPSEIGRRGLPLWQVDLNSWNNTRLYISQNTGEVIYVRHHAWRLFDLFWRLHIMDYIGGDEPENWLLAISSVISLCAIIAGIVILYFRMLSTIRNRRASVSTTNTQTKKSLQIIIKQSHKWLALIVFIQLLLWVCSGFLLARIDHSLATGQLTKLSNKAASDIAENEAKELVNINEVLAKIEHAESIHLELLVDQWVYNVQHKKGSHDYMESDFSILDAKTGSVVLITEEIARQIALSSYNREGLNKPLSALGATFYDADIPELPQEQNPTWEIIVNDALNTKIMINAQTGDLIAHVNDKTFLRNLLFKLHFMDYANEGSFNNIFSKLFALFTLVLSFTGIYWLYELVKDKQFSIPSGLLFIARRKKVYIKVMYLAARSNGKTDANYKIKVNTNTTILDGLAQKGFKLESQCGGGGVCGKCICQLTTKISISAADKEHLTKVQLEDNFRLACQHRISAVKRIIIHRKN